MKPQLCVGTGKMMYAKQKSALNALRQIQKYKIIPPNAVVYKCPMCGKWHLGHARDTNEKG